VDYAAVPEPERSFLASVLTAPELEKLGLRLVEGTGEGPARIPRGGLITAGYLAAWKTWEESGAPDSSLPLESLTFDPGSGEGFIPLFRTCMVPPGEPAEGKRVLSLDEARRSTLIPLRDLAPPLVARKVEGVDAADPAYPLVLLGGLRLSHSADGPGGKGPGGAGPPGRRKKYAALGEYIRGALEKAASTPGEGPPRFEVRPRLFRVALGGDAVFSRGVPELIFSGYRGKAGDSGVSSQGSARAAGDPYIPPEAGLQAVLGDTAELVKGADLALLNLEGVVSGRGRAVEKTYAFRFDPRTAPFLKAAGFDAVLLANNHAFDFGLPGFLDSLEYLEAAGLAPLGAGRSAAAAAAPFTAGERSFPVQVFGVASFGPERNGWDGRSAAAGGDRPGLLHAGRGGAELIKPQLRRDDKGGLDIVFFHGGEEYTDHPGPATRALYTGLIEAGADLVVGTHPHVEQGFEWVRGKPVFWSLGDYVFDEMGDTPGGDRGIFVVLSYAGEKLVYLEPYPLFMNGPRTEITGDERLERFYRLTKELAGRDVRF
jgi:poly-gamma-glutamate synthesis protein (capsule biosynthesis protein)